MTNAIEWCSSCSTTSARMLGQTEILGVYRTYAFLRRVFC
jgi:hypothetical protein